MNQTQTIEIFNPNDFDHEKHWYTKVINAQIHPLVYFFFNLTQEQIVNRYCHLNPKVDNKALTELLQYKPKFFQIAGTDLFYVTSENGKRQIVVIETNSSPSGQKSMPLLEEVKEQGGYEKYIRGTFLPFVRARRKVKGELAVLYDKNYMEASGYASAMADAFEEPVYLVPFYRNDPDPPAKFDDGVLYIRHEGEWKPIRAAHRYVTQAPWTRIPIQTKTIILNPIIACLAGGRNKMTASKAYDFYNAEISGTGLKIKTPETIWDVHKAEVPLWVAKMGGHAVIKNPYSNAGQGVYTITNQSELDAFMAEEHNYELFIVQSLIGNYQWSSISSQGKYYQVGTMPNKKGKSYVADIRMMVHSSPEGLRPLSIYSRRSRFPLQDELDGSLSSWDMLGTNLSIKEENGMFSSDSTRLMLMDRRDFNKLGIGVDELIEGFIQSVLCLIAIDKLSGALINQRGGLKTKLFRSLNHDDALIQEILLK